MEVRESSFKSLLDSTEDYVKTSVELFKLKAIDKVTERASEIISRALAVFVFFMFLLMVSIALGFLIGDLLGNIWYGFMIVAGFYGIIGVVLYYFTHDWFKKVIGNAIIKQAFKEE